MHAGLHEAPDLHCTWAAIWATACALPGVLDTRTTRTCTFHLHLHLHLHVIHHVTAPLGCPPRPADVDLPLHLGKLAAQGPRSPHPTVGCQPPTASPPTLPAPKLHRALTSACLPLPASATTPTPPPASPCEPCLLHPPTHREHPSHPIHVAHRLSPARGALVLVSFPRAGAAMDEPESSTASSVDFYASDPDTLPVKRKAEEESDQLPDKRPRRASPSPLPTCAGLPPAIWQHVFLCCSLSDLGRLLQVNRSFHSYLTDVHYVSSSDPTHGSLRLLKSDSIWASARNALPVKPPKPLPAFSELQMWQLVWSKTCQFCRKRPHATPGDRIWQKGPRTDGVRTIWPFAIRACGPCLVEKCQTVSVAFIL